MLVQDLICNGKLCEVIVHIALQLFLDLVPSFWLQIQIIQVLGLANVLFLPVLVSLLYRVVFEAFAANALDLASNLLDFHCFGV